MKSSSSAKKTGIFVKFATFCLYKNMIQPSGAPPLLYLNLPLDTAKASCLAYKFPFYLIFSSIILC